MGTLVDGSLFVCLFEVSLRGGKGKGTSNIGSLFVSLFV